MSMTFLTPRRLDEFPGIINAITEEELEEFEEDKDEDDK